MDDLNDEQFIASLSLTNRIIYIRRTTTCIFVLDVDDVKYFG